MSEIAEGLSPVLYTTLEGVGRDEFEEKRSVFIGHAAHVESEEEAMAFIKQKQKAYADATHNVWAYRISGGTSYSPSTRDKASFSCTNLNGTLSIPSQHKGRADSHVAHLEKRPSSLPNL